MSSVQTENEPKTKKGFTMINTDKLKHVLTQYKADFPSWWKKEEYKWITVKWFKDHWNIEAEDFGAMFKEATKKTFNLLNSGHAYPGGMICNFAKADASATREMFRALFDDSKDNLAERVKAFQAASDEMRAAHDDGTWTNHYQNTNAISVYLWLRFPKKYFIYKYQLVKTAASFLESDFTPKAGSVESMIGGYNLYNEIRAEVKADALVSEMIQNALGRNPDCYPDPEFVTAAIDVAYYLGTRCSRTGKIEEETTEQTENEKQYSEELFLNDVYLSKEQYGDLKNLLLNKKNIILQGAPGVGKTFAAKKLAYSIMGEKDRSKIEYVQFHQNFSYEDFVMGYRPNGKEFVLTKGVFYRFCKNAADDPDPKSKYFFIIDEINRGNLSKIFGELLMLIENDKRGKEWSVSLAYANDSAENAGQDVSGSSLTPQRFFVPENVYIIGMMNTADRSLAMIDYALRRRFSFFEMKPAFDSDGFQKKKNSFNNTAFDNLIEKIREMNRQIEKELGSGFQIGHSYFCEKPEDISLEKWMEQIVKYDIIPLLEEYWFDEPEKTAEWKGKLLDVIKPVSGETQTAPSQDAPSGDNTVQNPGQ